jgi:WD40 repeat protein
VFDGTTGRKLAVLKVFSGQGVREVVWSHDGCFMATIANDPEKGAALYRSAGSRQLRHLDGRNCGIHSLAFSSDNACVAVGSGDCSIRLWKTKSGNEFAKLTGHRRHVQNLAFSPDGLQLLSISSDRARVWCADTKACLWEVTDPFGNLFGNVTIGGFPTFGSAFFVDMRGPRLRLAHGSKRQLRGHACPTADTNNGWVCACLSADGMRVAIWSTTDRRVYIWATTTGDLLATLRVPFSGKLSTLAFLGESLIAADGLRVVVMNT